MNSVSKIKLILFDIGGVIIDYSTAFETASREQSIPIETLWNIFDKYDKEITTGKITPQKLYLNCILENNLSSDPSYNYLDSWLSDYKTIKPTYDLVLDLNSKYKLGLFSNIYLGMVPKMLAQKQLPNVNYAFKFISCDIGMQKPDIALYEYILKVTKLTPTEILFIDDRDDYLAPAIKAGWNTFKFDTKAPKQSVSKIRAMLDYTNI